MGSKVFQKSRSHLKIPGASRVTRSMCATGTKLSSPGSLPSPLRALTATYLWGRSCDAWRQAPWRCSTRGEAWCWCWASRSLQRPWLHCTATRRETSAVWSGRCLLWTHSGAESPEPLCWTRPHRLRTATAKPNTGTDCTRTAEHIRQRTSLWLWNERKGYGHERYKKSSQNMNRRAEKQSDWGYICNSEHIKRVC